MVKAAPAAAPPSTKTAVATAPKNCSEMMLPAVKLTITVLWINEVEITGD